MAIDDRTLRNEDYFEEYRRKKAAHVVLESQIRELEGEMMAKRIEMSDLRSELETMRKIITAIIDQGIDPTEARLRGTDDINDSLWGSDDINDSLWNLNIRKSGDTTVAYDTSLLMHKLPRSR